MTESVIEQGSKVPQDQVLQVFADFRRKLKALDLHHISFVCNTDGDQLWSPSNWNDLSELGLARLLTLVRTRVMQLIQDNPQLSYLISYVEATTDFPTKKINQDKVVGDLELPEKGNLSIDPSGKIISDSEEDGDEQKSKDGKGTEA